MNVLMVFILAFLITCFVSIIVIKCMLVCLPCCKLLHVGLRV